MKNDLVTAIVAAIAGVVISYFICNMFVGKSGDFSFTAVDSSVSSDLASPNPELFNYKSLNPTVEVYVGNCTDVNMYGECVDESSEQIDEGIIENNTDIDNSNTDNSNTNDASSSQSQNTRRDSNNGVTD